MTVLLALLTSEGIVFASDSQETFFQSGQLIARKPVQKIFPLGSHILYGCSGEIGMEQRVCSAMRAKFQGESGIFSKPIADLKLRIREIVFPIIKDTNANSVGVPGYPTPVLHTIFCGRTGNEYWIFDVDPRGCVEEHTERGFCAIGSGGLIGQFTIQSLAHLNVPTKQLYQGQMVAYRIIDDIIRAGIFGVGGDVQIFLLDHSGIRQLKDIDLDDLSVNVTMWKEVENQSLERFKTGEIPQ